MERVDYYADGASPQSMDDEDYVIGTCLPVGAHIMTLTLPDDGAAPVWDFICPEDGCVTLNEDEMAVYDENDECWLRGLTAEIGWEIIHGGGYTVEFEVAAAPASTIRSTQRVSPLFVR